MTSSSEGVAEVSTWRYNLAMMRGHLPEHIIYPKSSIIIIISTVHPIVIIWVQKPRSGSVSSPCPPPLLGYSLGSSVLPIPTDLGPACLEVLASKSKEH